MEEAVDGERVFAEPLPALPRTVLSDLITFGYLRSYALGSTRSD